MVKRVGILLGSLLLAAAIVGAVVLVSGHTSFLTKHTTTPTPQPRVEAAPRGAVQPKEVDQLKKMLDSNTTPAAKQTALLDLAARYISNQDFASALPYLKQADTELSTHNLAVVQSLALVEVQLGMKAEAAAEYTLAATLVDSSDPMAASDIAGYKARAAELSK